MARKQKKPRKHFKINLERMARHIGKVIDNTSIKEIADASLNVALAYAGYQAFGHWTGALLGPVSLKLAQTQGGTPPIAQISGVAGLAILGVCIPDKTLRETFDEANEKLLKEIGAQKGPDFESCIRSWTDQGMPLVGALAYCKAGKTYSDYANEQAKLKPPE